MKKFYLLFSGVILVTAAFSQTKTAQFKGFYKPNAVTEDYSTRGGNVLWSEDFGGGLPADWGVSTTSGPVNWKHTMVGHTGNYPTAPLGSTTASNGWMIADSDDDNVPGGPQELSRLISPAITVLATVPNAKLEFQQMFRNYQNNMTTVQISLDSIVWTDIEINQTVTQAGTPNPDYYNMDISSIAGNQDSIWIAFKWQGQWDYGWQIDDIAITEILDNDIAMKNEKFGVDVEYYMAPLNQVQPYFFLTDVENIGMLNQTDITLEVVVNDGSTDVYTGSSTPLATLIPWAIDSPGLNSAFTPSATGTFTIDFAVTQNETDQATVNNLRSKTMQVTDTVYALDNGIYQGQWHNQEAGAGNSNPFLLGGLYDIYTTDVASSISVFIGTDSDLSNIVTYHIYEFNTTSGEWQLLKSTFEGTITSNDLGAWKTLRLTQGTELTAGNTYIAAVEHLGGADYLWIGYSSNTNPGYTTSSDGDVDFGDQPRCPMIRLNFGNAVGIEEQEKISTSVYPNPATDKLNIQLNDLTNVNAELIDITGKVVMTSVLNNNSEMNVSEIARGVYSLRLTHDKNVQVIQVVLTK